MVVANVGTLGQPPFRWGPGIRPDDGRVDVCIVRARTLLDYLTLALCDRLSADFFNTVLENQLMHFCHERDREHKQSTASIWTLVAQAI